jgi:hypothetical protein
MINFLKDLPAMMNLMSTQDLGCFSANYAAARQRFLSSCEQCAPGLVRALHAHDHPLLGPGQETLACDVLHLGQSEVPEQLLVILSATHGVEGFAGSAIQCDVLPLVEDLLQRHATLGVVMIHAFNPWGFAWLRRYDHEGIDLNRNFVDFASALPDNPEYEHLHARLLASDNVTAGNLNTLHPDMDNATFLQAVTRGQYTHKDGFFFGGNAPGWSRLMLEKITAEPVYASAQRIAVIDLHTGLGPYGYGEVINDHAVNSAGYRWAENWYGDNAQSTALGDSVSSVKQGLLDYHWHDVMGDRGCFVTLEFGTYAAGRLLASLIHEQQLQNRISQSDIKRDIRHEHIQQLKQFFYPGETSWQQQVLFRGRQVIAMALAGIMR